MNTVLDKAHTILTWLHSHAATWAGIVILLGSWLQAHGYAAASAPAFMRDNSVLGEIIGVALTIAGKSPLGPIQAAIQKAIITTRP